MCACAAPCGKMLLYIALLDEGHGNSSHSFACLSGARRKRSLECGRREGETLTTTLSLRALPIACLRSHKSPLSHPKECLDRKSTRLNSSHLGISYAVF